MNDKRIEVLLVDDSAVVRGLLSRFIDAEDDMKVVASAADGARGVSAYQKFLPDLVILDIEMPVMDGITALQEILKVDPDAKIVMCSTLSTKNADITLKAMDLGAMDCIAKPTSSSEMTGSGGFRELLLHRIRSLGHLKSARSSAAQITAPAPVNTSISQEVRDRLRARMDERLRENNTSQAGSAIYPGGVPVLRPYTASSLGQKFDILAIGSSTGGPQALFKALKPLAGHLKVPLIITQHMPPTFTKMLAKHITDNTGVQVAEAEDGMKLEPGKGILAQGGFHMVLEQTPSGVVVRLNDGPMGNFCKPAVDPMLRSAFKIFGKKMAVAILTGMGSDGEKACRELVEGGTYLVAQDRETSVVWGMPGAVAMAGLCHAIKPIDEIGAHLVNILK